MTILMNIVVTGPVIMPQMDILLSVKVVLLFDSQTLGDFARSLSAFVKMKFATYKSV